MGNEKPSEEKNFWDSRLSKDVVNLPPSGIRVFFDIVAQKKDVISLGVGEPDFVTPQIIVNKAIESLRNGYTYYTGNAGLLSLRKEVSNFLKNTYNVEYNPENEILITVGVSQGIDLALRSIINSNDEVLYHTPSYVSYHPMIKLAGGFPKSISTSFENNFELTPQMLKDSCSEKTKAILLNYPCNPTGASYKKPDLEKLAKAAIEKDLLVISDEIYSDLSYDYDHTAISSLPGMKERTMLLGGFSKSFAMTGWRIGYAAGPKEWIRIMLKIHQYSMLCAPTIAQLSAETALQSALHERDRMKEVYSKRREIIVEGMNKSGLKTHMPDGAFYVFSNIQSTGLSSIDFAQNLLESENVAVIPGNAFGNDGEGFIRSCYATGTNSIKTALEKIDKFVNSVK